MAAPLLAVEAPHYQLSFCKDACLDETPKLRGLNLVVRQELPLHFSDLQLLQESKSQDSLPHQQFVCAKSIIHNAPIHQHVAPDTDNTAELPNVEDFLCVLQDCKKQKNLALARQVYVHACHMGLQLLSVLGNYILQMFADCASICDAGKLLNQLMGCNEYSWASLMRAHIECGNSECAFYLYQKMQEDNLQVSRVTYVFLLRACGRIKDLESGKRLHTEIAKDGYEVDTSIGSALVAMYAKCGSFAEGWELFNELQEQDVVAWNALLLGYTENELYKETLNCVEQMQVRGVPPDPVTFVCSLKACGSIGATDKGQQFCADIFKEGYESDFYIISSMLDMFAKLGSLKEAQDLFDELPSRDVVLWNALITGYTDSGCYEEVLKCVGQMRQEGVYENAITLVCCLKACAGLGSVSQGRAMHADIIKDELDRDNFVCNTLVDMYIKFGLFADAEDVFGELSTQDVISWTAVISGYAEHGFGEQALEYLEQMQREGVSPNAATFVCALKACAGVKDVLRGQELHCEIIKAGWERNYNIGNTLVDMYAKCGLFEDAHEVFLKLRVQDVVAWTALITGYVEHGLGQVALNCLKQMQATGVLPNAVTYLCCLKACASTASLDTGQDIHAEICKEGFEEENSIVNTLVDMYAKCGLLGEAEECFDQLTVQDVVSWNILVTGYADHGFNEKVLNCYQIMQLQCVTPYAATYLCSLKACGNLGAIDSGREVHAEVVKREDLFTANTASGLNQSADLTLAIALIDMYGKCGSMIDAQKVFESAPKRPAVTFNALITGYVCQGECEIVFNLLERMRVEGVQPDDVTLLNVLNVCSHVGLLDEGREYLISLVKDYDIISTVKHHTCIVDLLGRAGRVDEAVALVNKMSLRPDFVVWSTLLGACRKWGNVELGKQAFASAVQLEDEETAKFVLMSNLYAVTISSE